MDYEHIQNFIFATSSLTILFLYILNLFSGLYVLSVGVTRIDNFWYNFLTFSTLTSLISIIIGVNWFFFKQSTPIDFHTNFLWILHHLCTSICFLQIHNFLLKKLKHGKNEFWDKIKTSLEKVQKCS